MALVFTNEQILDVLTALCAEHGQTLEEREAEFGGRSGEFRKALQPPEKTQLNRNLRYMTGFLRFSPEQFMEVYRARTGTP